MKKKRNKEKDVTWHTISLTNAADILASTEVYLSKVDVRFPLKDEKKHNL